MSARETDLSTQATFRLMIDNLPNLGANVKRCNQPNLIVASMGGFSGQNPIGIGRAEVTVDISRSEGKTHVAFVFNFRMTYVILVAVAIFSFLLVQLILWGFKPELLNPVRDGLAITTVLFLFILTETDKIAKTRQRFMGEIDRFLPSSW